jgi:hypothetical protein
MLLPLHRLCVLSSMSHFVPLCRFGDSESAFFFGIRADPHRYIYSSKDIVPHLQHLRQIGTKVVVVSNSMPFFVRIVMQAAFAENWNSLFDLVVARSLKPGFFVSNDPACSFLHPDTQAPLSLSGCGLHMVFGGNDIELLDFINPKGSAGDSRPALFVGDSVTHDVIAPSQTGRWQAAAIVEEVAALTADSRSHPLILPPDGFPSMYHPPGSLPINPFSRLNHVHPRAHICDACRFGDGLDLSWWGHQLQQHAVCVRASVADILQQGSGLLPPS